MKNKTIKIIILLIALYFGVNVTINSDRIIIQEKTPAANSEAISAHKLDAAGAPIREGVDVVRVVDGDTIIIDLDGDEERVRLIGIDTPESVHPDEERNVPYGETASDFTKSMLEGKTVGIEFDAQERDQYGRLLAYVYLDGVMFNKTLLQEGHAKVTTYPPNVKYVEDFTNLQERARAEGKGLWAL